MRTLINNLTSTFEESFHEKPIIVRSPGRINIIGEHTYYNEGFVLPAAIDKSAYLAISLRDDDQIHIMAMDLNESFSVTVGDLKPVLEMSWPNYILGSAAQFIKRGIKLPGFNAMLTSDISMGAGLSSSAAVECATIFALNKLLKTNISKLELVQMAQKAEHEFAGVMCGIMDQFASMMGKKDHIIKLDCRSLNFEYVPLKLEGLKFLLLNTNVKHSLASSEYNTRRKECELAVKWIREFIPEVRSLRDVSEIILDHYVLPKNKLIDMRSRYVVKEIKRLLTACENVQRGNLLVLGEMMFATHDGLKNQYAVSCKELDWLVEKVKCNEAVLGARMMGGGFGGCTINLVKEEAIDDLLASLKPAYEREMNKPLMHYVVSIGNGTEIVE